MAIPEQRANQAEAVDEHHVEVTVAVHVADRHGAVANHTRQEAGQLGRTEQLRRGSRVSRAEQTIAARRIRTMGPSGGRRGGLSCAAPRDDGDRRQHSARHTDEYVFHQLLPYLGNKRTCWTGEGGGCF
jgi:hypothetical protein